MSKTGEPCDRLASLPGGMQIFLDALSYRKQDNLRVYGNLGPISLSLFFKVAPTIRRYDFSM